MDIQVHGVKYHRNGVSGQGFFLVGFTWVQTDVYGQEPYSHEMVGWVYSPLTVGGTDEPNPIDWRSLKLDMAYGVIDLAEPWNTWRGDHFFPDLCAAIEQADIDGSSFSERGTSWDDKLTPGVPRLVLEPETRLVGEGVRMGRI
jgi:hypothetical protein